MRAGFIDSHVTSVLIERGHRVTVIDNLSRGHRHLPHPRTACTGYPWHFYQEKAESPSDSASGYLEILGARRF